MLRHSKILLAGTTGNHSVSDALPLFILVQLASIHRALIILPMVAQSLKRFHVA
ncbi:hypothetical protein HV356_07465 [Citrobacter sp. RHBSTW-01065]|nr:hypothetical protein [Citrobacter sp. RHBSTW-01065]